MQNMQKGQQGSVKGQGSQWSSNQGTNEEEENVEGDDESRDKYSGEKGTGTPA